MARLQLQRPGEHCIARLRAANGNHREGGSIDASINSRFVRIDRQIAQSLVRHEVLQVRQALGHRLEPDRGDRLGFGQERGGQSVR